jgi:thymidylate synthase
MRAMIIRGGDVYEAWRQLLWQLTVNGREVSPRGLATKEILGVQLRIDDAYHNIIADPVRRLNFRFLVAEMIWMAAGLDDLAPLTRYNREMAKFSDDGARLAGAYGPRLAQQWTYVVDTLLYDASSRGAVSGIWRWPQGRSKDVPCTLSMQWLIRAGLLETIVTMRSSDAWLGIPYDVASFTFLSNLLCCSLNETRPELNLRLGGLIMNLGSSHLYGPNWEAAYKIADLGLGRSVKSPPIIESAPLAAVAQSLVNDADPAWDLLEGPWLSWARCLRAGTSEKARVILEELEDGRA